MLWHLHPGSLWVHLGSMSDSHVCCRSPSSLAGYRAAIAASILQLLPMPPWRLRLGGAAIAQHGSSRVVVLSCILITFYEFCLAGVPLEQSTSFVVLNLAAACLFS